MDIKNAEFTPPPPIAELKENKNIRTGPSDSDSISYSYILVGIFVTLALLLCGAMALWCRRKYQEYFIRERDALDVPDIIAGEMYYGMVKDEDPMMSESTVMISERTVEVLHQGPDEIIMNNQSPTKLDTDRSNNIESYRSVKSDASSVQQSDSTKHEVPKPLSKNRFGLGNNDEVNTPIFNKKGRIDIESSIETFDHLEDYKGMSKPET